ncbi:MAG: MltA domain-containing protein [Caulobacteraceae bacterium]
MRYQLGRMTAVALAAGWLAACATARPTARAVYVPPRRPLPAEAFAAPPPSPYWPPTYARPSVAMAPIPDGESGFAVTPGAARDFADLVGWTADDHVAAVAAFERGCAVTHDAALAGACARAPRLGTLDEGAARAFLETNFRPEAVGGPGLLTAYFSPVYEARSSSGGAFTAPVRPRPADLEAGGGDYPDRAAIEARPAGDALAWMRPEELFFLQIQGSGVLVFPGGTRARAIFDGTNGAPFVGIATALRQARLLAEGDTSADAIKAWLADNRGQRASAMMALDPRYVFFRLGPDDGGQPTGAAGTPLIPGRSVAVDSTLHPLGEMVWIDATAPSLAGAFPAYRRLAVALDTGGAIRGAARADLYLGEGPVAGAEAGRVRHALSLWRLVPIDRPGG